ncbi:MAG: methylase, partial [Clostridia bacterium]|nr:methylase [Clostridia bacterium]
VARTALWIAESQMMKETEDIVHMSLDFLPLKTAANIVEGNALRLDWNEVVDKNRLNYIMGNPPFVGHNLRTDSQKEDMTYVFGQGEAESKLDYVICWYQRAIELMEASSSHITAAFVSTNSICQGESVPAFWKQFIIKHKAEIQFAYPTFIWDSEASSKAHVHCVILGFTHGSTDRSKKIYNGRDFTIVDHINPYIIAAPDVWLENRTNNPQGSLPKLTTGSQPMDYGNFILDSAEKDALVSRNPVMKKYIKPFIGAFEFLHDPIGQYSKYCLWLDKADLSEIRNITEVRERIENVQRQRSESKIDRVKKKADLPYLFCQIRQPKSSYLVIPRHSSQSRRYIPIGFMMPDIIAGDACTIIPNLGLYEFGVLTSNVHMAWVRVVCGRIKSDFRYQASVYNNFPWPHPTEEEKQRIVETAQGILNARTIYSSSCLADLYDPTFMPPELRKAHQENDKAVMAAYGIKKGDPAWQSESACVAMLMKLYQELTEKRG